MQEDSSMTHPQCSGWEKKVLIQYFTVHGLVGWPHKTVNSSRFLSRRPALKHHLFATLWGWCSSHNQFCSSNHIHHLDVHFTGKCRMGLYLGLLKRGDRAGAVRFQFFAACHVTNGVLGDCSPCCLLIINQHFLCCCGLILYLCHPHPHSVSQDVVWSSRLRPIDGH